MTTRAGSGQQQRFFFLDSLHVFVSGSGRSVLYDLQTGDVIALDAENGRVLAASERGLPCNEIADKIDLSPTRVTQVLEEFESRQFGRFVPSAIHVEKAKIGRPVPPRTMNPQRPTIQRLFVEIGNQCDLECAFCAEPTLRSCLTCSSSADSAMSLDDLLVLLDRFAGMDVLHLIVCGGDPLIERKRLARLTAFWNEKSGGRLSVITNGERINTASVDWLRSLGVELWIPTTGTASRLLSGHDSSALQNLLRNAGITAHFSTLLSEAEFESRTTAEETLAIPERSNSSWVVPPYARLSASLVKAPKPISRTTLPAFTHNQVFHPCLDGTLAVAASGHLLPCPALEQDSLGTVESHRLVERIFETRDIDRYWRMSLSSIHPCGACALRFACMDCRGVEQQLHGDIHRTTLCPQPQFGAEAH
jgi:radical SAM protein with 4Fe4S-binding SPASM domain